NAVSVRTNGAGRAAGGRYVRSRAELKPEDLVLAESLSYQYGESYDAYLLREEGRQYFFSCDGCGVIGFSTGGGHAHVIGGWLTAPDLELQLCSAVLVFGRRERLSPTFFSILRTDRELFRQHGSLVSKTAEEPITDLKQTD